MATTQATAPGKVILFGEHAVVYGRPAIAAPVSQVRAIATVRDRPDGPAVLLLPDLGERILLDATAEHPLAVAAQQVQRHLGRPQLPPLTVTVQSAIPIAGGLGSGAALAAALIRALLTHLDAPPAPQLVGDLTYEVEKLYHGTPSGIDNTVVALEQPVYFVRRSPRNQIEPFRVACPVALLIGDTGVRSSTRAAVEDVRRHWTAQPARFEALFDRCGALAEAARRALECGDLPELGRLMDANHAVLQEITVSSAELDRLTAVARAAGALGAKLSGAGRGGNMIALVHPETAVLVEQSLKEAGARQVLHTVLLPTV